LPPSPPLSPWAIFGHAPQLKQDAIRLTLEEWAKEYGPIMSLTAVRNIVVLNDVKLIKEALISRAGDFNDRNMTHRVVVFSHGRGFIDNNWSPRFQQQKKLAIKSLKMYGDGLSALEDISRDVIEDYYSYLDNLNGKPSCFSDDIFTAVTNVITSMVLGKSFSFKDPTMRKFKDETNRRLDVTSNTSGIGVLIDRMPRIMSYMKTKLFKDTVENSENLHNLMKGYLDPIKKDYDSNNITCFAESMYKHYLEGLSESEKPLIDKEDFELINFDVMFAGYATTSVAMQTLVLVLMNHPEIEAKLVQEIHNVLGAERFPTLADKANMPYAQAVILELLRYLSQVCLAIPHATTKETEIGGYKLPKGVDIWMNLWYIHHDEKIWDKPYTFKPERFLEPETGDLVPPGHSTRQNLLPFGAGSRFCLGETLAKNRLFLFTTSILQRYRLLPPEGETPPTCDPRTFPGNFLVSPPTFNVRALKRKEALRH